MDVVTGIAFGIVVPILPLPQLLGLLGVEFSLPVAVKELTTAQKGAGMFFVSWALVDVVRDRILNRFQPVPQDRRANDKSGPLGAG